MKTPNEEKAPEKKPEPADQIAVTKHRAKIAGKEISYTVTCGTLVMREEAEKEGKSEGEKARATVFFVAYTHKPSIEALAKRLREFVKVS